MSNILGKRTLSLGADAFSWKPRIIEHEESFEVQTVEGRLYLYFEDEPLRRSVTGRPTKAEARHEAEKLVALSQMRQK